LQTEDTMTKIRNRAKEGIDKMSRGARQATDKAADVHEANMPPGKRAASKVKSATERAGTKVKRAAKRSTGR
jgi:hypothetical protein